MTRYDALYHGDPEDCTYTEAEHRLDYRTGLCVGHTIARPPAECICHEGTPDRCARSTDPNSPEEAPYCPECFTTRVYGIPGRDCTHEEPDA